jgi:mono/diheme cytochrome c family protein
MRSPAWPLIVVACLLAARQDGTAQSTSMSSTRSTLSGVYTTDQATRGQEIYALACVSCHTPASHTGPAFVQHWIGRPLAELVGYISETMPQSNPGGLTPEEYVLVTAYLLRMNGLPSGAQELPADLTALQRIRFDTRPAPPPAPRPPAPRPRKPGQARWDEAPRPPAEGLIP